MRHSLLFIVVILVACAGAPGRQPAAEVDPMKATLPGPDPVRDTPVALPREDPPPRRAIDGRRPAASRGGAERRPESMTATAVAPSAAATAVDRPFDPASCPDRLREAARVQRCVKLTGLITACREGGARTCGHLGDCRADQGGDGLSKAIALYRHACARDDGRSCAALGRLLVRGRGLPKDRPAAWRHMRRACDLGDARGCGAAGVLRYLGAGVDKDEDKAATLLEAGCKGDDGAACLQLAILHARGAPKALIERSSDKALALYRKACGLCQAKACHLAATRMQAGGHAAVEIIALRRKACTLGHITSCHILSPR